VAIAAEANMDARGTYERVGESEKEEERARGVLLTGATGLVGGRLLPALVDRFDLVRTLSRGGHSGAQGVEARRWDGVDPGEHALDDVDTVIHLAGEPIFGGLPTASRMERVRASRIDSTRRLVDRMLDRPKVDRPSTFVCASAVGFYGDCGDAVLTEDAPNGEGLLAEICRDWESEAVRAEAGGIRVVRLRIAVVLSADGGALALMKTPFKLGIGGKLGRGRQFFPWIHLDDLVRVIFWCLDEPIEGPVNAVAPEAVRNSEFTRSLASVLSRPAILPVPGWAIRLALGPISGELLGSRRVDPDRLVKSGFVFDRPTLRSALAHEFS
jgi:uncharacterized protein (TIGR01777 family)